MTALVSLFLISWLFSGSIVTTDAWDIDDRCLRRGRRILRMNETYAFDDDGFLNHNVIHTVPLVETVKIIEKTESDHLDDNLQNLERQGEEIEDNLLSQRILQEQEQTSFNLKLYWYEGVCWQEEWREREWCMQCGGRVCGPGDNLWIDKCRPVREQRFQWIPTNNNDDEGRLKTAFNNLCLQKIGSRSFELRVCSGSRSQILVRSSMNNVFELHPVTSGSTCLSQHHHPKPDEEIYGQPCREAREHRTSKWEIFKPGSFSSPNDNNYDVERGDGESLFLRTTDCSSSRPCGKCEGDCDSNSECEGSLRCFQRNDNQNIPGCFGTGVAAKDYCYENTNNIFVHRDNSELQLRNNQCTNSNPCHRCQGDCDSDIQCEGSLHCFQRSGNERIPGCSGRAARGRDYCYAPSRDRLRDRNPQCSYDHPCTKCEGDCDNDNQCEGNLKCYQTNGFARVPGCDGTGIQRMDYCYDP